MQTQMLIDDIVLLKCIGKGSFGEVYLSQKKGRPEFYATKKMDKTMCETPTNFKRLNLEVGLLQILNHPNIVKYIELKQTLNNWYLITEFCNGGSLLSNLQKYMSFYHKPFSEEIVQHLMKQIISALSYLHFNKIIHRDLKLDNILVNFPSEQDKNSLNMMSATVKIIDFGFATLLKGALTFTALGTPNNMDPQILEQITTGVPNKGYNEKVDIWSLGTLCYEMLVGHRVFSGNNMQELYQKVKKGNYSLPIYLSKEVVSFINGMIQKDPKKRLEAKQLLNHDFIKKHPSQFQPIDLRQIGSIGPGGVINMKSDSNPPVHEYNDNFMQLWGIFDQNLMNQNNYQDQILQPKQFQLIPQTQPQPQIINPVQQVIQFAQGQSSPVMQIPQNQQPYMEIPTTINQQNYGFMNPQNQYNINSNPVPVIHKNIDYFYQ